MRKRVKKLRREYKKEWDKFQQLLNSWQDDAIKINDLHDEISGKRLKRKGSAVERVEKKVFSLKKLCMLIPCNVL